MPLFRRRRGGHGSSLPTFSFDGDPDVTQQPCTCCSGMRTRSIGFVLRDNAPFAAYWLFWYPEHNEAWLDATLGYWDEPTYTHQYTFGCRIGAIDGHARLAPW